MNTPKIIALLLLSSMTCMAQDIMFNEEKIEAVYGREFLEKIVKTQNYINDKGYQDVEDVGEEAEEEEEEGEDERSNGEKNTSPKKDEKTEKLIKETLRFVELKKQVDSKIIKGRKDIRSLRKRLYNLKRVEDAERKNRYYRNSNMASNIRQTAARSNTEKIADYKIAIPQLVSFSNELKALIDENMTTLKEADLEMVKKHPVLSKLKNHFVSADGSERTSDMMDQYHPY